MSEILAFSESADSDPKLSTEPVSESGDIHTATDVPPQEAPAPEPDSPETTSKDGSEEITHESASEAETMSSEEKKNTYTDFSSEISNILTIPKKIRLPEKRKVPTTAFSIRQRN